MANKKSVSKFVIGAGVTAAAAAGVVAFLTQTKRGKQLASSAHRQALELAKRVAQRAEQMKDMTRSKYDEIVDDVVAEYQKKRKLTQAAAEDLARELKKEWDHVKRELRK